MTENYRGADAPISDSFAIKIKEEITTVVDEILEKCTLKAGDIFVVGCSSSEIVGSNIGKGSSFEAAKVVFDIISKKLSEKGIFLAAQCCEHLNRALVVERACAEKYGYDVVSVIPQPKAGGSFATLTYENMSDPVVVEHIKALKSNVPIEHPVYSFVEHNRMAERVPVKPSKVIIIDGILIFENKELRDLMDIKVYVDTDADVRLARRILRDVCERGRSMQSVIDQYLSTVKLMHEEFVEPSKKYADVIIPEGGFNSVAVDMLIHNIKSLI